MRKLIPFLLAAFSAVAADVLTPGLFYRSDTRVVGATNLVFLNQHIRDSTITNSTAVLLTGSLTNVTLDGASLAQAFAFNTGRSSGTNAYFNAGRLTFADGQTLTFEGGSIACIASRTNYVGINLFTGTLHALRRAVDHGTLFLGAVVCGTNSITRVESWGVRLPTGRVERFKAAIQNSQHKLKLVSFGNSIMASAYGGATNKWMDAIFSASASPTTYQLANTSGLTWKDYSYGGQKSREALMFLGQATTPAVFTAAHAACYVYGLDYIARNWSTEERRGGKEGE